MAEQATDKWNVVTGGLIAWIQTANHGLCAQAKKRVSEEIRSHHAEAFAALCDSGLTPETAYQRAVEGLGMLLYQAVPGFSVWFGVEPVVDDVLRRFVAADLL